MDKPTSEEWAEMTEREREEACAEWNEHVEQEKREDRR